MAHGMTDDTTDDAGADVETAANRADIEALKKRFGGYWKYNPDTDSYCTGADYGVGGEIVEILGEHKIPHDFAVGDSFAISVPAGSVKKVKDLSFTDSAAITGRMKQAQAEADLIDGP